MHAIGGGEEGKEGSEPEGVVHVPLSPSSLVCLLLHVSSQSNSQFKKISLNHITV